MATKASDVLHKDSSTMIAERDCNSEELRI